MSQPIILESTYDAYYRTVDAMGQSGTYDQFKSHPRIIDMFEHVNAPQGWDYLHALRAETTLSQEIMQSYCAQNDRVGGGHKTQFGADWTTSPSNFRYLYHAHLILTHLQHVKATEPLPTPITIVEVGCGYGGLCLAVLFLASHYGLSISSYHLVDLPAIGGLQQYYLSQHANALGDTVISYHSAFDYGTTISGSGHFFISNYCFSEISAEHQAGYRQHLLNPAKVSHGLITWNHIPVYDFGFPILENVREEPNTAPTNRYIYF